MATATVYVVYVPVCWCKKSILNTVFCDDNLYIGHMATVTA